MECRVAALRLEHRRAVAVGRNERQEHRDEDQHRRRGNTDERVGRTNGTAAHLARFGNDGRLELVERRVRGSAELLGGSTELLARRLARRSVTRLTVLLLTGLLTEGGLLALLRLGAKLGLTLRLSVYLRRVAEGRLRDLFFGRQGGSGLVARRGLGLRRALEDCLLEVVIVCLGGLAHGSLGLDVGSLGLDVGSLGFCGSLNVRLFGHGLLDGGLGRGGVSLGLRFFVDTGERLGLLAGFLRGGLGLGDRRFLSSRGLRGNDTLVR